MWGKNLDEDKAFIELKAFIALKSAQTSSNPFQSLRAFSFVHHFDGFKKKIPNLPPAVHGAA